MKPNSPCLNCEDRFVGCHAECEKYAEYQVILEAWKEEARKTKRQGCEADDFRFESLKALKKMRGKK